ncbi:uncharacterized protein LOC108650192 [Drosophila navojoa]|uniref:uncharacterized protein LOC108650192 n=1 Tax=Drosophila navojoa TaxID=7232 RepID=UPI0011BDDAC4|nr:uncharacterized protein LOC108650192 [Drosophila navojoa]
MLFPFVLLLLATEIHSASESRFTNIECRMLDPSYAVYEQCELKILGRGIVGLNIYSRLKKGPFNNAKYKIRLLLNSTMWLRFGILLMVTNALSMEVTRFTNVECKMLDPSYATYEQCELKILGRGIIGLNIYARLNKGPFNNAKVANASEIVVDLAN